MKRSDARIASFAIFAVVVSVCLLKPFLVTAGQEPNVYHSRVLMQEEDNLEQSLSLAIFMMVLVLMVTFSAAYAIRESRVTWIHESSVAIILGLVIGVIVRFVSTIDQLREIVIFDQNTFFLFLLPPIIFASGFNMQQRRKFFENFLSIGMFAFLGTLINAFVFAGLLFGFHRVIEFQQELSFLECLIFGSLISATDPVTVLAIFKQLAVDPDLYANVFGESVLNDAVAIVLVRTVSAFTVRQVSAGSVFLAIGEFFLIFFGSFAIGVIMGLWSSLLLKWTNMHKYHELEHVFIVLFAYSAYLLADGLRLSGIVAILFCGITMAHYSRTNLSAESRASTHHLFETIATIAETFVFAYLGLAIFSFSISFDIAFILICLLLILIARAVNVFPLSLLVSVMRKRHPVKKKQAVMMWFVGLRGAIAFALALELPTQGGHLILTTTLLLCIFSVIVFGSTTGLMCTLLDIDMHLDPNAEKTEPSRIRDSKWLALDRRYLKPFFTRLKSSTHVDDELAEELPPDTSQSMELDVISMNNDLG